MNILKKLIKKTFAPSDLHGRIMGLEGDILINTATGTPQYITVSSGGTWTIGK